jgi:hypothetical protein
MMLNGDMPEAKTSICRVWISMPCQVLAAAAHHLHTAVRYRVPMRTGILLEQGMSISSSRFARLRYANMSQGWLLCVGSRVCVGYFQQEFLN